MTTLEGGVSEPPRVRRRPLRITSYGVFIAVLAAAVIFLVAFPLVQILLRTFIVDGQLQVDNFTRVVTAPWFGDMVRDTAIAVGVSGVLALIIATFFAWVNERTDAGLGTLGTIVPLVPLLVPTVAVAIGWTFLLSPRVGFLNTFLNATVGGIFPGIAEMSIYSWGGLIGLLAMLQVPYAYLIISSALKNIDPALEEASRMNGGSLWRTMTKVSLPAIMPAMIGAGLLLLIEGLTAYAAPVIIARTAGIDILSVRMVRMLRVVFPPDTGGALSLSAMMILVILVLWLVQRRVSAGGMFAKVSGRARADTLVRLGPWKWVIRTVMIGYLLFASVLPLAALLLVSLQPYWTGTNIFSNLSFRHYEQLLASPTAAAALRNSMLIGIVGGSVGMLIAAALAIFNNSASPAISRWVDGLSKLPAAVPNIVLAIGFLIAFGPAPFNLAGTIQILILAYLVINLPQASIAASVAASQVGKDMSEAAAICGAGQGRTFRTVLLPLMSPGLIAGWGLLFVHMAGEVTAASILANARTPVVGFAILEIFESGTYGQLAALSAIISVISAVIVSGVMYLTLRRNA